MMVHALFLPILTAAKDEKYIMYSTKYVLSILESLYLLS